MKIDTITTEILTKLIGDDETTIIDTRQVDAYNGWRLRGEKRGGHIKGAKSIPSTWTLQNWWKKQIESKNIPKGNRLVLYDYDTESALRCANAFMKLEYENIVIYEDFVSEWAKDENLLLEKLPRYQTLIPPQWLKALIEGKKPENYDNNKFVICHSHYRHPEDYDIGHIPNAIALDTLELEEPNMWNRRTPQEIRKALERHGITKDTTVICYGRFSYPKNDDPYPGRNAGHIAAHRNALIMLYAGVEDVRILNGGLMSWERKNFPTMMQKNEPIPAENFGTKIPQNPQYFIDLPEAKEYLASDESELVSIRSWEEFIGEVSGYNYIDKKGRIPGAIFGNCGSDAYHMENFRNPDHTTREYGEILQNWIDNGITPDKNIAFYCGTGWRASEAFFNAYYLGWNKIAVYDGGWMEWSSDPNNPMAVGTPK